MRRAVALLSILATVIVVTPAEAAGPSCRSGGTVYERDGVRVFETDNQHYWACSGRVRRPRTLVDYGDGGNSRLEEISRRGNRLAFAALSFGEESSGWEIGWFDVRSGKVVRAAVSEPDNDTGPEVVGLTVAPHGGIAAATVTSPGEEREEHTIYYRPFAGGKLGAQRKLAAVAAADIDVRTLASSATQVTWRTNGEPRSIALDAPAAPPVARAAAMRASYPRCGSGSVVVSDYVDLFNIARGRLRGLWACSNSSRRTTRIGPPGKIGLVANSGGRQAFEVLPGPGYANGALGVFESRSRALRLHRLATRGVAAMVLIRGGGLGYAAPNAGGYALTVQPATGPPRVVARLAAAELEPLTLRATPTTLAWQTVGQPRAAAL